MMNRTVDRRLPAEWESHGAVLISWPHGETDWAYMLEDVIECFTNIVKAIVAYEKVIIVAPDINIPRKYFEGIDNVAYCQLSTNDTWARDFGPITLIENGQGVICDFKFNGWGLKFASDKDNLITQGLINAGLLTGEYRNRLNFVLEGGSIESDGKGTLLTTSQCLLSRNRNGQMSRDEIEDYLCEQFGLKRVLWLDNGALAGDDTDSHIDTLARLAPNDTILYVGTSDEGDSHYAELQAMKSQLMEMRTLNGMPYNLIELPLPDPIYDDDGFRLPATYANFLILQRAVLLPIYGQKQKDVLAEQLLKVVFPDHDIVTIDCRALIQQHGSLHCVTMQIPNEIL